MFDQLADVNLDRWFFRAVRKWRSECNHDCAKEIIARHLTIIAKPYQLAMLIRVIRCQESRAPHVGAGASIDLDRFAFLDEERNVDFLSSFERGGLGDIARSIAAQTFR